MNTLSDGQATPTHAIGTKGLLPTGTLPIIDPNQLVGYPFPTQHAGGTMQKVEVLAKEEDKCHVEYADGNEDHLTNEDLLNKETENGIIYGHSSKSLTTG